MPGDRKKRAQERHVRLRASIWNDEEFVSLPMASQWLYMLIISQPGVTLCGVVQPAFKRWATFAPDTTADGIEKAALTLQERFFIEIDDTTDELLVRSFVRHGVALDSDNAIVGMAKSFETIHSKVLRKVVLEELRKDLDHDLDHRIARTIPEGEKPSLRSRLSRTFVGAWEGPS